MLRPCPFLHAQQLFLRGLVLAVDRCYPPDRIDVVFPLLYHTTKHVLLRLLANHCVFVVPVGVPLSFDLVHHLIVCNLFCTQTAQEDRKKKKEDIANRTSKQLSVVRPPPHHPTTPPPTTPPPHLHCHVSGQSNKFFLVGPFKNMFSHNQKVLQTFHRTAFVHLRPTIPVPGIGPFPRSQWP